jgi:hypothetical protein
MDLATLFQARQYLAIKAHTPGALRLGVNPAILGDARFKSLASGDADLPPGILGVDVSIFTMSVTLRYDPERLPAARVEAFFGADEALADAALAALQQTLEQGRA